MLVVCSISFRILEDTEWGVLEMTVGHWPFSDQFIQSVGQHPFWLAKFTVHFQWDSNQKPTKYPIFKKTAHQFLILISAIGWAKWYHPLGIKIPYTMKVSRQKSFMASCTRKPSQKTFAEPLILLKSIFEQCHLELI